MGKIKGFLSDAKGNTAIIFALAAVPLLLAAGVSIDMARANRSQAMLQAAADAAALAAAASIESGKMNGNNISRAVATLVSDYVIANHATAAVDQIDGITAEFDKDNGELSVSVRGKMNTSLMKLAGIDKMDIVASSEVVVKQKALEVVLVLDNTGSMAGGKIAALKVAAANLTEAVFANVGPMSSVKVGVVPFSEYVSVGMGPTSGGWLDIDVVPTGSAWEGCVGSRPSPEDEIVDANNGSGKFNRVGGVNCVTPLLPLTDEKDTVLGKISAMGSEGDTYIPSGLLWGWHVLQAEEPISGALSDAQLTSINGTKAIVLMTDGANTISPAYPLHTGSNVAQANELTAQLCQNAKAANIKLFTVAFEVTDVAIKEILDTCATEPGMSFDAVNAEALNAAFSDIAEQLSSIHLSK
jgi:Flp pilus assembly protein TadG